MRNIYYSVRLSVWHILIYKLAMKSTFIILNILLTYFHQINFIIHPPFTSPIMSLDVLITHYLIGHAYISTTTPPHLISTPPPFITTNHAHNLLTNHAHNHLDEQ